MADDEEIPQANSCALSTYAGLLWAEEDKESLRWERLEEGMPTARHALAAVAVHNHFIVLGGSNLDEYLPTSEMLDLDTEKWLSLPPMPTERESCAAVALAGHVVVVGGYNDKGSIPTAEMLDMERMQWISLPPMSQKRHGCVAVALPNHEILVMGGCSGSINLRTVETYNTQTQKWTNLPPMPTARRHCAAALVDDCKVYVFGGVGGEDAVEMYHVPTKQWTVLEPMPFSRMDGTAVTIGKQICLVGGHDGVCTRLDTADMFDTQTNTWIAQLPNMDTKRQHCAAAFCQHNQMLLVAGGLNERSQHLSSVEKMAMDHVVLPCPPDLPPLPLLIGRSPRQAALQRWVNKAVSTKSRYLTKVDLAHSKIEETFSNKCEILQRELRNLEAQKTHLLQVLTGMKDNWIEEMSEQLFDAQDQLDDLLTNREQKKRRYTSRLVCPITGETMRDPVVAADGHTYERNAIEKLMSQIPKEKEVPSPVTGKALSVRNLFPNRYIQDMLCPPNGKKAMPETPKR